MKFKIGDIVTLSFAHNLPTDPPQIATVISLGSKNSENIVELMFPVYPSGNIVELMFPDGYNDTYGEDQVELLSRQDDPEKVQQSQSR